MESRSDDGSGIDAFAYWVRDNCYIVGIADGREADAIHMLLRFKNDPRLNFSQQDAERLTAMVQDGLLEQCRDEAMRLNV